MSSNTATMPFLSHLVELRKRLMISIAAVFVGALVAYIFAPALIRWISDFYTHASHQKGAELTQTTVLDGFLLRVKVASYGGIVLACPIWLYQLWRFVTPGLKRKEKRYAFSFVGASILLFIGGGAVSLFTLTKALQWLLSSGGVKYFQVINASSYVTFVVLMFVAFGISFEFPVVLVFLMLARIITPKQLSSFRRPAILIIVIFAAVITPSADPYSLFLMAVPMYIFYESSIIIGRMIEGRRHLRRNHRERTTKR